jgi:hypothetical protein
MQKNKTKNIFPLSLMLQQSKLERLSLLSLSSLV